MLRAVLWQVVIVAGNTSSGKKYMKQFNLKFAEDFQKDYIEDSNEAEHNEFIVKST